MMVVELRRAGIPFLGWLAAHYWFVVRDEQRCERWEVWQTKNAGGRSIGHLHCNLKPPEANVGGGPTQLVAEWRGDQARALIKVISGELPVLPHLPLLAGPQQQHLRRVGAAARPASTHPLGRLAVGKNFPRQLAAKQ